MNLFLPRLFSDAMVLQRNSPIIIWGTAGVEQLVTVTLDMTSVTVEADKHGKWTAEVPARAEGRDLILCVRTESEERIISDICMGDVWLCSGQSNMEWPLELSLGGVKVLQEGNFPELRLFDVPNSPMPTEEATDTPASGWQKSSVDSLRTFSAVGFFFAKRLKEELKVPIGLISSSVGGTPIEAWTSRSAMEGIPAFEGLLKAAGRGFGEGVKDFENLTRLEKERQEDARLAASQITTPEFARPDFKDDDWAFEELPYTQFGVVWGRKWIEFPSDWEGKNIRIHLDSVQHFDTVFWDGECIGSSPFTEEAVPLTPEYQIPVDKCSKGKHLLAIRILVNGQHGGLMTPRKVRFTAEFPGGIRILHLQDNWKSRVERSLTPSVSPLMWLSGNLFNGMIAPLIPFPIRGCIWYQGESNADQADYYRKQFKLLIEDWRERWGFEFPFYFVQLANWGPPTLEVEPTGWSEFRVAQASVLSLPQTGMASAIDVGDAEDIHPRDKRSVGERLAAVALQGTYGQSDLLSHGPRLHHCEREQDRVRLHFQGVGSGLCISKGDQLLGYSLAGEDGIFHPANAYIDADTVVVHHPEVPDPLTVCYAWARNPICTLANHDGFPGEPFFVPTE